MEADGMIARVENPASRERQIRLHARCLERWFRPADALDRARYYVESGHAWSFPAETLTPEAAAVQPDLFGTSEVRS
jgi:hypothetical protein